MDIKEIKRRIAKRQAIGNDWDGRSNEGNNVAWPLATALIKEGNAALLKYAMKYRKIHDSAKSESTLGGSGVNIGVGVSIDQRQQILPNGEIAYKGERRVAGGPVDLPATRRPPADSDTEFSGRSSVPKPWKGDRPVNSMIDAQAQLSRLQSALGYLCEPFELACIDGRTLQEVGNAAGIANRAGAMGAGRALVHTALAQLRDCMGDIQRGELAGGKG